MKRLHYIALYPAALGSDVMSAPGVYTKIDSAVTDSWSFLILLDLEGQKDGVLPMDTHLVNHSSFGVCSVYHSIGPSRIVSLIWTEFRDGIADHENTNGAHL